jgi:heme oxygenase
MSELRHATWPCHQRLERRIDVRARFTSVTQYRAYLERMWGFCVALERALDPGLLTTSLRDYEARRKVPLLTSDLAQLGRSLEEVTSLPRCERLPGCGNTAAALGCVYVFEGATLGGRSMLPLVASNLGIDAGHGAAFLASYGAHVGSMWQGFRSAMEISCVEPAERARAVGAAIETFECLGSWLCESPR